MNTLLLTAAFLLSATATFLLLSAIKLESLNRAWLRRLKDKDRELAERLRLFLPRMPQIQSCCRIMLVIATLAAACCWSGWYHHAAWSLPLRWIIIAATLFACGAALEIADLALRLRATARCLRLTCALYRLLRWPLAPLMLPLDALDRKIQRTTDIEDRSQITAADEILSLVEEDDSHDAPPRSVDETINDLESDEKRMLNGVMNLDKTLVHEVMTPRVDIRAICESSTIREAKSAIAQSGHSRIPVYKESIDSITGILYAKDLLDERRLNNDLPLHSLLHQPMFIPETKNVAELLNDFRRRRIHIAIVLDEYGGTAGIVSIEDVLEEIVGEIHDEYDHEETRTVYTARQPDGALLADARMTIWEVNQALDLEISEENGYDTIGGYIMARLGRIPHAGEHIDTDVLAIDIITASPRCLKTVRLKKITPAA